MKISSIAAVAVLGLTGTAAFAQATNTGWYVAPTAGVVLNDSSRNKSTGGALGLAVGKVLNEKWNVEFGGQYLRMDGKNDEQGSIGVDGLYFFNRNPDFAPYAVAGLGYVREARAFGNTQANDNLLVKAGLGFTRQLSKNVDFRTDARYQWHTNKTGAHNLGDWVISAGLNIYFGDRTPAPAPYVAASAYVAAPVYVAPAPQPAVVTPPPVVAPAESAPVPYVAPHRAIRPDRN
ncbi:hypothetical protein BH10PSE16_BH10PSE16_03390 [soil metagenome]